MNNRPKPQMATRDWGTVYYIKGQLWMPHYTEENIYVAAGGEHRTVEQLIAAGAVKSTSYLWPREWQKKVAS